MRLVSAMLAAIVASSACAQSPDTPQPEDLLELLGSDDPAVREVGRRALELLPAERAGEVEELAARATDPEVQAVLAAAAAGLRRRPLLLKADAMAREAVARPRRAWRRILEEGRGALPVLMLWLPREDLVENPLRDPDSLLADRSLPLGTCAAAWLGLITGEEFGRDQAAWEAFFEARQESSLEELAVQALVKRGYRVADGDAGVAAAELLRAIGSEPVRHWEAIDDDRWYRSLAPTAEWLVQVKILGRDPARFLEADVPPAAEAADWLAANRGHVVWRQGTFGSSAGPGHWLGLLDGADDAARRGALRCLVAFPIEAAPAVRPLLEREPRLVAAVLAAAKSPATAEDLPRVLPALEYELEAPEFAGIWDPDVLAGFAAATEDGRLRELALLALAGCGSRGHAGAALGFLRRDGGAVATAAAIAVAELGDDAQAREAIPWIERTPGPVTRSVAVALAARGIPEGFAAAREAAARGDLLSRDLQRLTRCVNGAPGPGDEDAWRAWARGGAAAYRWDPAAKKWVR